LETGSETGEPDLELSQREQPFRDAALDRNHWTNEASRQESCNRLNGTWNQCDLGGLLWLNGSTSVRPSPGTRRDGPSHIVFRRRYRRALDGCILFEPRDAKKRTFRDVA
jgi:hypothetical protein